MGGGSKRLKVFERERERERERRHDLDSGGESRERGKREGEFFF